MSLILDAIKKSERERQQQEVPGLAANHEDYQSAESSNRRWPFFVGLLILILLVYLWVSKDWKVQQSDKIKPVVEDIIEQVAIRKSKPLNNEKINSQPIQSTVKVEQKQTIISSKVASKTDSKIVTSSPNKSVVGDVIPLDHQLESQLPSISFSSHVYTGNRATSFVVLNDELLGVGEKFNDDIEIVEINKEGLIILFDDQQIFIKALENINL